MKHKLPVLTAVAAIVTITALCTVSAYAANASESKHMPHEGDENCKYSCILDQTPSKSSTKPANVQKAKSDFDKMADKYHAARNTDEMESVLGDYLGIPAEDIDLDAIHAFNKKYGIKFIDDVFIKRFNSASSEAELEALGKEYAAKEVIIGG